jgi:putative inorganic carbon (HCO3(-)) transporter
VRPPQTTEPGAEVAEGRARPAAAPRPAPVDRTPELRRPARPEKPPRPPKPRRPRTWAVRLGLSVVALTVAAAQLGLTPIIADAPMAAAIVPVLALGLLLAVAALCRFELFLAALLLLRPLVDVLKSGGPDLVQPTTLLSLLLLLIGPLWLVAQRRHSGRLPLTPLVLVTGAFLASFALSALGAADVADAGTHVLRAASWFVMFLLVRRLAADRRTLVVLLAAVAASAAIPALLSAQELLTPGMGLFMELKDGVYRLRGTFDQSNNYARYLMLVVLAAVAASTVLRRRARLVPLLAALAMLPLLFLTYARTAWIGLAAGLVVMAWVAGRRRLVAAVAVAGIALLAVPGVLGTLFALARPTTANMASQNNSLAWRLGYWREILTLGLQRPLTGLGPDGTVAATVDAKEPHNEYLRAAIEGGVIGLVAYLMLLAVAILVAVRVCRRANSPYERAVGLTGVGVVVALAVAGIASNIVLSVSFMWYFAVVLGVVDHVARSQYQRPVDAEESSWT